MEAEMRERYELAMERITEIETEERVAQYYRPFFCRVALFLRQLHEIGDKLKQEKISGNLSMDELGVRNQELYEDILPNRYQNSYANPVYACKELGDKLGGLLCFLYTEMRSLIPFVYEQNINAITIRLELFLEVYSSFCFAEDEKEVPSEEEIRQILYWFVSDYADEETERRIKEQVDPNENFAVDIILNSELTDLRYLYAYGERITENEIQTAAYLNSLSEAEIETIAGTYAEGFRKGFEVAKKPLASKKTVNIRYRVGFERVIRKAILLFKQMGLSPILYRAGNDIFSRRSNVKIGYYGAIANQQYEYDHSEDMAYFLDGHLVTRRLECLRAAYEKYREEAKTLAGPACIEVFGEEGFNPIAKTECARYSEEQQLLAVEYLSGSGTITNEYIRREERSFTIIAFPIPAIGPNFSEIFKEVIRINTLDYQLYSGMQQILIRVLDTAEKVHILGKERNRTDLTVGLTSLDHPNQQTKFENCVADVNIPVGEVFTSPNLEETNGVLHVTKVFLNEFEFHDLEITFQNGVISDYSCANFEQDTQNRAFIEENLLFHHKTLPMGEFAIGTNTTAYAVTKKFAIADKMPILIAEKMGPHFAIGDTCYSQEEEVRVFNPDGKEMIAKENRFSKLRKSKPKEAYFHCHTDITIPYDELDLVEAISRTGERTAIIQNGRFVLPGCEELNKPLDE